MPKIPTYSGGASFSGSYAPNLRVNSEQVDAALKQNVETLEGFAQRADKLEAGKARTELMQRLSQEQEALRADWSPDSGDDFVTKAQERYSEISDEYMSNASNKRSRDFMSSQFGDIQSAFILKDQQYTYNMQSKESARQLTGFANEQANAAFSGIRPDKFEESFDQSADDLQVHHDLKEATRKTAVPAVWSSWFYGRIERADTPGEYDTIHSDLNSGKYDDKLTPQNKITLANLTDSRKKTSVTKKKVSVKAMFQDAMTVVTTGGPTDVIPTKAEFDLAIASINAGDNPEEIRTLERMRDQVLEAAPLAQMSRQDLMKMGAELSTDESHLREGSLSERADAIESRAFKAKVVGAYLKAWQSDPHGRLAQQTGDDLVPIDLSNPEAIPGQIVERMAINERLVNEQGLLRPDLWYQEDKVAFRSAWAQADSSQRIAMVQTLQQHLSLDTVAGRRALAEAGEAATDGSVLKFGFMVRDPRVMDTLMKGASNEPLLKGSKSWSKLENYARYTVLPLFHEENPGLKEEFVKVLSTYVAGSADIKIAGEKGSLTISDFKDRFDEATEALLGTGVELNSGVSYFPRGSDGKLIDKRDIREAINNSGHDAILKGTGGGIYDHQRVLMDNQQFVLRNSNFLIREEGVMMRVDFADGTSGLASNKDGSPLLFDVESLIDAYNTTATRSDRGSTPAGYRSAGGR